MTKANAFTLNDIAKRTGFLSGINLIDRLNSGMQIENGVGEAHLDPDQFAEMLLSPEGGIGNMVAPHYMPPGTGVGGVSPYYPGQVPGVGLPIEQTAVPMAGGVPVEVSPTQYVAANVSYMGLGDTLLTPLVSNFDITLRPLRPIRPQKIGFPSNVQDILINQITIGGTTVFANNDGIPIEMLSEVSIFPQIAYPTIDPATGVVFQVTNLLNVNQQLRGMVYGTVARR